MRASLNTAVRLRMIPTNPAVGVKLPRAVKRDMVVLTPEEVTDLANHPAITPHYRLLILTAAYTGLRAGELGALRVRDIDLLHNRVTVSRALKDLTGARLPDDERVLTFGPTKTHATRTVSLPKSLAAELSAILKPDPDTLSSRPRPAHRSATPTSTAATSARPSPAPRRYPPAQPSVPQGSPRPPSRPGALPAHKATTRFHDLRHSHAALLIASGAHPKLIQARLGHTTITMTLDTYGHLFPSVEEALAHTLDALYATPAPAARSR